MDTENKRIEVIILIWLSDGNLSHFRENQTQQITITINGLKSEKICEKYSKILQLYMETKAY